jgi:hypothetical protein
MVCFDITLAYPSDTTYKARVTQEKHLEHLRRNHNADTLGSSEKDGGGFVYRRFALCDEDAVGLLWDIPHPVYCVSIKILRTDILLYSCWKLTQQYVIPPRKSKLLKDIYWSASQLERRLL